MYYIIEQRGVARTTHRKVRPEFPLFDSAKVDSTTSYSFPLKKARKVFFIFWSPWYFFCKNAEKKSILPVFTTEVYSICFYFSLQIHRQKNAPFVESCHKMGHSFIISFYVSKVCEPKAQYRQKRQQSQEQLLQS